MEDILIYHSGLYSKRKKVNIEITDYNTFKFTSPYDGRKYEEHIEFLGCGESKTRKKVARRVYQILECQNLMMIGKIENKLIRSFKDYKRSKRRGL